MFPALGAIFSRLPKSTLPATMAPMPKMATMAKAAMETICANLNEVSAPAQLMATKITYRASHHTHISPWESSE
ncbi:MAG: hypothetical protein ACFWT0_10465 [Bifidobacterium crudilactis]